MEPKRGKRGKPKKIAYEYIENHEDQLGFEAMWINSVIGWGMFATREFLQENFLLEYTGKVSRGKKANKQKDTDYNFHFKFQGEDHCIDATKKPVSGPLLGRLVNHGDKPSHRNAVMKCVSLNSRPHLCFFSTRSIAPGEQILYNYGVKIL